MNPDHLSKCQKCNQEIKIETYCDASVNKPEKPMGVGTVAFNEVTCPKCGYPCQKENTACPNCGTAFIQETPQSMNTAKTVILNNSNFADYNQKEPLNNNSFLQAHDKTSNVNCNQFAATQIDYNINN